jgi:hypothetical protein
MKTNVLKSLSIVILLAITLSVRSEIIYDNSTTDTGTFLGLTNGQLAGDQIIMANTSSLFLTNFSFEYYSPNTSFSGSVQADVAFYANDGTPFNGYATPGTSLFDSGPFSINTPFQFNGTNAATLSFDLTGDYPYGLLVPTNFTFVVSFTGLASGDVVGVELFNPVTVGQNTPDYWFNNNNGGWQLLTNSVPVNFGAQFQGTVPEPSVISLAVIGGATLLAAVRRRRK